MKYQHGYWKSLDQLAEDPEFLELAQREFHKGVEEAPTSMARRRFLQLMGASMALAGSTSSCRWETTDIVPLAQRPEGRVPGERVSFATLVDRGGVALPLLATSYEGRPIKIEGNPGHPEGGGTDGFAQAAILGLYDPDRSRSPAKKQKGQWVEQNRRQAIAVLNSWGKQSAAGASRILAQGDSSPTLARLRTELKARFPKLEWLSFEAISQDGARAACREVYGEDLQLRYDYGAARTMVTVGADPLASHTAGVRYARDWAKNRKPDQGEMNRLYALESRFSQTGGAADHRIPLHPRQLGAALLVLWSEVLGQTAQASPEASERLQGARAVLSGKTQKQMKAIAADLVAAKGLSFVHVGEDQDPAWNVLGLQINAALGAIGKVVHLHRPLDAGRPLHDHTVKTLCEEIESGKVKNVLLLGGNPVFASAYGERLGRALEKIQTVHVGSYRDETFAHAQMHIPLSDSLESFGDGQSLDGTHTLAQPLIDPLYSSLSPIEVALALLGDEVLDGQKAVQITYSNITKVAAWWGASTEQQTQKQQDKPQSLPAGLLQWREDLARGFVANSQSDSLTPAAKLASSAMGSRAKTIAAGLQLQIFCDSKMYDGRFANNAWLQEHPEFLSKLTWDNAAIVGVATAKALDLHDEEVVKIQGPAGEVKLPVLVRPGVPKDVVLVARGYGRTQAGYVGGDLRRDVAPVGVRIESLLTQDSQDTVAITLSKTGKKAALACTQSHHSIDPIGKDERERRSYELVRQEDLETYRKNPDVVAEHDHHPPLKSLFSTMEYKGEKWSMAIDLGKCVGCNACSMACQSENNIPVVGKDQVSRGREMSWIRIDRYFRGEPEDPEMVAQPVACVHCENAPCEQVCPVAATVHSDDGLNSMVYNRCIGTRYCANNCPYKVRRFNYHAYAKDYLEPMGPLAELVSNPEVTVRFRGVMEKCTYCVQRLSQGKESARLEARPLVDSDVTPACAQACPTQAIAFGDAKDPKSEVTKQLGLKRSYAMLAELNVRPRTQYLARIKNPNPRLEGQG